jgi:hypothetical protein
MIRGLSKGLKLWEEEGGARLGRVGPNDERASLRDRHTWPVLPVPTWESRPNSSDFNLQYRNFTVNWDSHGV